MFGSSQRPPMPRFAATYLSFFATQSVCIGVYPWLKTGSVAATLLQVFRVFRGRRQAPFEATTKPGLQGCVNMIHGVAVFRQVGPNSAGNSVGCLTGSIHPVHPYQGAHLQPLSFQYSA